jgi:hypothetical protein
MVRYTIDRFQLQLISSGFEALVINSTGFTGIELLHVTKAVAIMGKEAIEVAPFCANLR